MKIVQWAFPFVPSVGGRETFIWQLSSALQRDGDEVLLIAPARTSSSPLVSHEVWRGLDIIRLNIHPEAPHSDQGIWERAVFELATLTGEFGADLLHFHRPDGLNVLLLRRLIQETGLPAVYTSHGPLQAKNASQLARAREVLGLCAAVVSISPPIHHITQQILGNISVQHRLILNGVPERALGDEVRSNPTVFAFGRMAEEKGFHVLVHALALLAPVHPELRATIAGTGPDQDRLAALASALRIDHLVDFPGWLEPEQVANYLDHTQLVVIPSIWEEPFGLVAAEAMMAGCVVVATNRGFLPQAIDHGSSGWIVEASDPDALARGISDVLSLADTQKQAMAATARSIALERFSHQRMVGEYQELYRDILSHHVG